MTNKLTQALLIPVIGLLPLIQAEAAIHNNRPATHPSPHENTRVRDIVIRGALLDANTIQINSQDLAQAKQEDKPRVITLIDAKGNKQRFMLLPSDRANLVKELLKHHGRLKEFRFYTITDENGNHTEFLASKRIITAPANQLTVLFNTAEAARHYFSQDRLTALAQQGYVATSEPASKEVNNIDNQIQVHMTDHNKENIAETPGLFPTVSIIIAGVVTTLPPVPVLIPTIVTAK